MNVSSTTKDAAATALQATAIHPASLAEKRHAGTASKDSQQHDLLASPPAPLRFPWLSRLSNELQQASNKPSPYGSAPVIGDNLNEAA